MSRKTPAPDIGALIDALPPSLARLARRGVAHPYKKGSTLIEEGTRGDTLYIVLAGRLRVYSTNLQQDKEITYGTYGPGEYLGELSLDGGLRAASVKALERSVCVVITRTSLEAHLAEHPEFAFELLAKVIALARRATLSARQMALNDVYGRIKLLLESLVPADATIGWTATGRITYGDIAARVGCHPSMVSKVMKDLEAGGHIDTAGATLRLKLPLPARW
jgi:CRP/FNR family cyclic AMP-dependent transcriptional regulator